MQAFNCIFGHYCHPFYNEPVMRQVANVPFNTRNTYVVILLTWRKITKDSAGKKSRKKSHSSECMHYYYKGECELSKPLIMFTEIKV